MKQPLKEMDAGLELFRNLCIMRGVSNDPNEIKKYGKFIEWVKNNTYHQKKYTNHQKRWQEGQLIGCDSDCPRCIMEKEIKI